MAFLVFNVALGEYGGAHYPPTHTPEEPNFQNGQRICLDVFFAAYFDWLALKTVTDLMTTGVTGTSL